MRFQNFAAQAEHALVSAPADEPASMGTRRSGRIEDRLSFVSGRGGWHPTTGPEPNGESTHAATPVQKAFPLSCADSGPQKCPWGNLFTAEVWRTLLCAGYNSSSHFHGTADTTLNKKSRCCADAGEACHTNKRALKRGAPHATAAQAARRPSCVVMKACLPHTADQRRLCCDRGTSAH